MTTIHHATRKAADALGVTLTPMTNDVLASWDGGSVTHPSARDALQGARLGMTLTAEYPSVRIAWDDGSWVGLGPDGDCFEAWDDVPSLTDVLDAAVAAGIDPEAGLPEDDEPRGGSIVPDKYRAAYAEAGHPAHCGDWLAVLLQSLLHDADGRIDLTRFRDLLVANGVDLSGTWADQSQSDVRGWSGRFRMTGRNALETRVAIAGHLIVDGDVLPVPADELAILRAKRHRAVAKAARLANRGA